MLPFWMLGCERALETEPAIAAGWSNRVRGHDVGAHGRGFEQKKTVGFLATH